MKETKYVHRIPPCSVYDVAATQHWLESMAAKGLILEKDGFFAGIAIFLVEEPRILRYRLDATPTKNSIFSQEADPEEEQQELNRLMGWRYRGRRGQFHIYVCDDPDAPELHTDPRVQAISLQSLNKYLTKEICNFIIYFLTMYLLMYSKMMVSMFLLLGTPAMTLVWLSVFSIFAKKLWGLGYLLRLQRQLKAGIPPQPSPVSFKKAFLRKSSVIVRIIAEVLCVVLMLSNVAARFEAPSYSLTDKKFPFMTLSDIYPEATVQQEDLFLKNEVRYWTDWLCPEIYDYSERANITHPDGSKITCYMRVEYYDARWEWVSEILARELPRQQGAGPAEQFADRLFGQEPTVLTELDVPGLDYCVIYEEHRNVPYMVLRRGTTVIRLCYPENSGFSPEELASMIEDFITA